jgi:hypothetical protein
MADIEDVIRTNMAGCNISPGTQLTVGNLIRRPTAVQSEEGLRLHAHVELNAAVEEVVEVLGIKGFFTLPSSGNITLVGEPDFSWISGDTRMQPKLVVCITAPALAQRC